MSTRVQDNEDESRFEIVVDDAVAGFVDYQRSSRSLLLTHAEIDGAYEGQGLGSRLVTEVLGSARDAGIAVLPRCPFVAEYIRNHPEHADLVPEDRRPEFGL